jgi:type IV pilus assembly protein PilW
MKTSHPICLLSTRPSVTRQRGTQLIELLVAMVIGLLLALVLVSALTIGEAQKRTTSASSVMGQSGAYAASVLDIALRNAGSGLMQSKVIGCNPGFTGKLPPPFSGVLSGNAGNLRVAPVLIAQNSSDTTPASDVLMVMSGSGSASGIPRGVASTAGDVLTLKNNTIGIVPDASLQVLIDQPDGTCAIHTVTAVTSATLTLDTAPEADPSIVLPLGNTKDVQFNLLGVKPDTQTLYSYNLMASQPDNALQPLTGNVLAMQALYGIADSNGRLARWVAPTGDYALEVLLAHPSPPQLHKIVAIRVALVLKGNLREKTKVTTTTQSWFSTSLTGISGLTARTWTPAGDDQYYRYRIMEFVVPVRNGLLNQ